MHKETLILHKDMAGRPELMMHMPRDIIFPPPDNYCTAHVNSAGQEFGPIF